MEKLVERLMGETDVPFEEMGVVELILYPPEGGVLRIGTFSFNPISKKWKRAPKPAINQ